MKVSGLYSCKYKIWYRNMYENFSLECLLIRQKTFRLSFFDLKLTNQWCRFHAWFRTGCVEKICTLKLSILFWVVLMQQRRSIRQMNGNYVSFLNMNDFLKLRLLLKYRGRFHWGESDLTYAHLKFNLKFCSSLRLYGLKSVMLCYKH